MSSSADEISRVGPADAAPDLAAVQPEGFFTDSLREGDAAVADAVAAELDRQQNQIELIASENIVSRAVLEAQP